MADPIVDIAGRRWTIERRGVTGWIVEVDLYEHSDEPAGIWIFDRAKRNPTDDRTGDGASRQAGAGRR